MMLVLLAEVNWSFGVRHSHMRVSREAAVGLRVLSAAHQIVHRQPCPLPLKYL